MPLTTLPVVRRKAHSNDVAVNINNVVQRIKELLGAPLLSEHRAGGGHLVGLDALNA